VVAGVNRPPSPQSTDRAALVVFSVVLLAAALMASFLASSLWSFLHPAERRTIHDPPTAYEREHRDVPFRNIWVDVPYAETSCHIERLGWIYTCDEVIYRNNTIRIVRGHRVRKAPPGEEGRGEITYGG
jgi:hypothetical protein